MDPSMRAVHPSQFGLNHIVRPFTCACGINAHNVRLDGKITVLALAIFAGVAGASAGGFFIGAGSALLTYYLLAALYKTRTVSYIKCHKRPPPGMFILRPSFFGLHRSSGHVFGRGNRRVRNAIPFTSQHNTSRVLPNVPPPSSSSSHGSFSSPSFAPTSREEFPYTGENEVADWENISERYGLSSASGMLDFNSSNSSSSSPFSIGRTTSEVPCLGNTDSSGFDQLSPLRNAVFNSSREDPAAVVSSRSPGRVPIARSRTSAVQSQQPNVRQRAGLGN